jgi:hypothetical protein
MDARDVIALPTTLTFVAFGFAAIIRQRIRFYRQRAREQGRRTISPWAGMSPAARLVKLTVYIVLGIGVALVLQVAVRGVIDTFYP